MSELPIPEAAYEAGKRATLAYIEVDSDADDCASDAIRAAAPLVVGAELRRLAQDWRMVSSAGEGFWFRTAAELLERRAAELENAR